MFAGPGGRNSEKEVGLSVGFGYPDTFIHCRERLLHRFSITKSGRPSGRPFGVIVAHCVDEGCPASSVGINSKLKGCLNWGRLGRLADAG